MLDPLHRLGDEGIDIAGTRCQLLHRLLNHLSVRPIENFGIHKLLRPQTQDSRLVLQRLLILTDEFSKLFQRSGFAIAQAFESMGIVDLGVGSVRRSPERLQLRFDAGQGCHFIPDRLHVPFERNDLMSVGLQRRNQLLLAREELGHLLAIQRVD